MNKRAVLICLWMGWLFWSCAGESTKTEEKSPQTERLSGGERSTKDAGMSDRGPLDVAAERSTETGSQGDASIPDKNISQDRPVNPDLPSRDQGTPVEKDPGVDKAGVDRPPVQGVDYTKAGPFQTKAVARLTHQVPSSTGCQGTLCTIFIEPTLPTAGNASRKAPYPLAIISNGFLLGATVYKTYAQRLASWGYVVLRWDTNNESPFGALKHEVLGKVVSEIINWAKAQAKTSGSPLFGQVDLSKIFVVGHSRGGKISALAAQSDARIGGLFGIDPVDSAPPGQSGSVSAIQGMSKTNAPFATVGAGKGAAGFQACAPTKDNYAAFYAAAKSPAWALTLPEVGHMQFLDSQAGCLPCLACAKGSLKDSDAREITQVAMIAWAEKTMRGANIDKYISGSWIQSLIQKGTASAQNK